MNGLSVPVVLLTGALLIAVLWILIRVWNMRMMDAAMNPFRGHDATDPVSTPTFGPTPAAQPLPWETEAPSGLATLSRRGTNQYITLPVRGPLYIGARPWDRPYLALTDPAASARQAMIEVAEDGTITLTNLSQYGTGINGDRVRENGATRRLTDGDVLRLGDEIWDLGVHQGHPEDAGRPPGVRPFDVTPAQQTVRRTAPNIHRPTPDTHRAAADMHRPAPAAPRDTPAAPRPTPAARRAAANAQSAPQGGTSPDPEIQVVWEHR